MGRKCSVSGCRSNFESQLKKLSGGRQTITVYGFPIENDKRDEWIQSLPCPLTKSPTKHMGICSLHWPTNAKFLRKKGRSLPDERPSIFENLSQKKKCVNSRRIPVTSTGIDAMPEVDSSVNKLSENSSSANDVEALYATSNGLKRKLPATDNTNDHILSETKKIKVNGIKESFSPRNGVEIVENGISESSPVESPVKVEVSVENKLEISGKVPAVEEEKPSLPNEHQLFLEETKLLLLKKIRQSQTRTNVPPTPAAHQINKAAQQPHQQFNQNVNNQQKTVSSNLQHKHQVNRPIMQKSIPPNAIPSGLIRGPPPSKVLPSVNKPLPSKAVNNVHDHQAAAKREQAAKLALKKELEKTLLQIPPPKPPPANLDFIPWPSIDFLYLIGLEESVHRLIFSNTESTENEMPAPFLCRQCNTDFTTLWKREEFNGRPSIICEQCMISNNKKAVKKEHTNRLKNAVEKALQQEQEIVKKIKEEENQRKSISPQTHLNSNQKSSHVSASSRGRILNPAPASAAPRTLAPVSATSLRPQLY